MVYSRKQLLKKKGADLVPHLISAEAAAKVAELYERDFDRFGYDPELPFIEDADT